MRTAGCTTACWTWTWQDASLGAQDAAYWNAQPALLPFAGELLDVAVQATSLAAMPAVKRGSRTEAPPDQLFAEERDAFLSSTARLTAAAPLQVVSDGQYLLVFRQSITAGDADAVFQLAGGGLSGIPRARTMRWSATRRWPRSTPRCCATGSCWWDPSSSR